jgi:hypothetical protein
MRVRTWGRSIVNRAQALLALSALAVASSAAGQDLSSWEVVVPGGSGPDLRGICYGNGMFVAVGDQGSVATSSDGQSWVNRTSGVSESLAAVAWSGSVFVAVGQGTIVVSTDGASWIDVSDQVPPGDIVEDILWDGTRFVAVGGENLVLTSTDGLLWVAHPMTLDTGTLHCVALVGNTHVAAFIPDLPPPIDSYFLYGSPEGGWSVVGTPQFCPGVIESIAVGQGLALAVGWPFYGGGPAYRLVYSSTDGEEWTLHDDGTAREYYAAIWPADRFFVAGTGGIDSTVDAVSWEHQPLGGDARLLGLAWNGQCLVAVGEGGIIARACRASVEQGIPTAGRAGLAVMCLLMAGIAISIIRRIR